MFVYSIYFEQEKRKGQKSSKAGLMVLLKAKNWYRINYSKEKEGS